MTEVVDPEIGQKRLFEVEQVHLTLFDRFLVPPFSVLDARGGYWQSRKREWLALGIKSELGRDEQLLGFESIAGTQAACEPCGGTGTDLQSAKKCRLCAGTGKKYGKEKLGTTSVFDPVLCELLYRWFCPVGGRVLDPFAGGSVRGIVAGMLHRHYTGIELRPRQVAANYQQAWALRDQGRMLPAYEPLWVEGDARSLDKKVGPSSVDFVFSCPPYFDLEVYSDDPRDLSQATDYTEFLSAYGEIIGKAIRALKPNRFACFVVGEVRSKKNGGAYLGLVRDTIDEFVGAGAAYFNELIFVTPLGSVPVRTSAQFGGNRKVGKTHQNVLVFCKGDPSLAAAATPVEEVAVEMGGAVWRADGSAEVPETGEEWNPE